MDIIILLGTYVEKEMTMASDSDESQKSKCNRTVSKKPIIKSYHDPNCVSDSSEGATEEVIHSDVSQNNSTTRNCEQETYSILKHQIGSPSYGDDKHCSEQFTLYVDQLQSKVCGKVFSDKKHKNEAVFTVGIKEPKVAQLPKKILALHGSVGVVSDPAKGCKLNYEELEDRMKTFKLPPQWDGPVEYQLMAEAGFVYTGQEDLVFCFSCNVKLDRWSKDMEPLLRHKKESPTCSFKQLKEKEGESQ